MGSTLIPSSSLGLITFQFEVLRVLRHIMCFATDQKMLFSVLITPQPSIIIGMLYIITGRTTISRVLSTSVGVCLMCFTTRVPSFTFCVRSAMCLVH